MYHLPSDLQGHFQVACPPIFYQVSRSLKGPIHVIVFFSQSIEGSITASSTPRFSPPLSLPRFIACTRASFYPQTLVTHQTYLNASLVSICPLHFSLAHLLSGKKTGKVRRELWPAAEDPPSQCCLASVSPGESSSRVRTLWVQRQLHW